MRIGSVLATLCCAALMARPASALAAEQPLSLASPSTRYTAQIHDLGSFRTEAFEAPYRKFRIDFLGPGKRQLASTVYAARYRTAVDDQIRSSNDVRKRLVWDKRERFALVMNTENVTMSSTDTYEAIALDPKLSWRRGEYVLDHATWVTPQLALGERHGQKKVALAVFDLTTGQTRALVEEEGDHGYRIARRTPQMVSFVRYDRNTRKPMGPETLNVQLSDLSVTKGRR